MKDKFYNFFIGIEEYSLYGLLFSLSICNGLVETFVCAAIFGFVGRKIVKPDFGFIAFRANIFLIPFVIFSALSVLNSGIYLNISLHALLSKWTQYLLIYIITQDVVCDQKIIRRCMLMFLLGASLAVLSGLSQYFFGMEFLRNHAMIDVKGGLHAITSSFNHYNSFSGYLVFVLSLAAALLLAADSFDLKTGGLLVFSIFSTLAFVFAFSRGSWLAMAASFIFMAILSRRYYRWLMLLFFAIVALFLLSPAHHRLFYSFHGGVDSERFEKWLAALNMIKAHPFFGIGAGTFMANFSKYMPAKPIAYAHNCYLQMWAETGIFSLASFAAFIISTLCAGVKKFVVSRDFLLLGLLGGAAGFLIHSFFDVNLYSLRLAILFWTWIGLIVAKLRHNFA